MSLISRFKNNKETLLSVLMNQKLVSNNPEIAEDIATNGELVEFLKGDTIITQDSDDQDVYFLLTGEAKIFINGTELPQRRKAGVSVGEMSVIEPSAPRSATLIADEVVVAVKVDAQFFNELISKHPSIAKDLMKDLANRLKERNALIDKGNMTPKLFIISTVEALEVAKDIKLELEHEKVEVTIWSKPSTFIAGSYPLDSLEEAVKTSDFGLAIMSGDDIVISRGEEFSTTRDNVIFELGLFMGSLGRLRTLIAVPRGKESKLASDLQGLTPLNYTGEGSNLDTGNLVTKLVRIMKEQGVR